jgi:NADPH:quinone reductase-like Zn-dependent oxidoreductase
VDVFAVQLARLAGSTVIGTASEGTFEFVRQLGAEPVAYGLGLAGRVRALAPGGVRATRGGADATPADLERITGAILAGQITVPIAATFPIERIRDAVQLQAGRHVHGKIVITL